MFLPLELQEEILLYISEPVKVKLLLTCRSWFFTITNLVSSGSISTKFLIKICHDQRVISFQKWCEDADIKYINIDNIFSVVSDLGTEQMIFHLINIYNDTIPNYLPISFESLIRRDRFDIFKMLIEKWNIKPIISDCMLNATEYNRLEFLRYLAKYITCEGQTFILSNCLSIAMKNKNQEIIGFLHDLLPDRYKFNLN